MKKVVFSVTKEGRSNTKTTGVGYVSDTDLLIPAISKSGKAYIRVFQDCVKHCRKVKDKEDEFKAHVYEIHEVEIETNKNNFTTREIEVEYQIWFKYAK